jgi:hypothetical protein
MKKVLSILLLTVLLLDLFAVAAPALAADNKGYLDKKLKPYMDDIGNALKDQLSSADAVKDAFKKAKSGVKKLKKYTNKNSVLKNDSKVQSYLSSMEKAINEGHKRAKNAPDNDSKMMKYQKNAMKYLKKYRSRVEKLFKVSSNGLDY